MSEWSTAEEVCCSLGNGQWENKVVVDQDEADQRIAELEARLEAAEAWEAAVCYAMNNCPQGQSEDEWIGYKDAITLIISRAKENNNE